MVEEVGVEEVVDKVPRGLVEVEVEGHQVVGREEEMMGQVEDRLAEEVVVVEVGVDMPALQAGWQQATHVKATNVDTCKLAV
jgi:hypothetical protein